MISLMMIFFIKMFTDTEALYTYLTVTILDLWCSFFRKRKERKSTMDWDDDDLPTGHDQYEQEHEDEMDMLREMESQGTYRCCTEFFFLPPALHTSLALTEEKTAVSVF